MKKYIIILIILLVVTGLIWAGITLFNQYKQNECEQAHYSAQKLSFFFTKCISECPFDSRENLDPCVKACSNASEGWIKKSGFENYQDTKSCLNHLVKIGFYKQLGPGYAYADPAGIELQNCTNNLLPSIVRHATNASVIVNKSCIQDIAQKYPKLVA